MQMDLCIVLLVAVAVGVMLIGFILMVWQFVLQLQPIKY
jgi:hypothetical protein